MKINKNNIERGYELFHYVAFTLLVVSIAVFPLAWGYSIWGIGLSVMTLGVVQFIVGILARIRPSIFRLKSIARLDIWLVLSLIDLIILGASIRFELFEIILGTMLIGICLSIVQYSALTSKKFKH